MAEIVTTPEITALIDKNKKVIIDWSPKAGCTVLIKMFFKNMGLLDEALAYNSWIHEYRMHVFSKEHPTELNDLQNPEYFKIKFVRNPFHRAVSSYMHTMRYEVMHAPVKKVLWRWNANISFKTFVKYLSKIDLHTCDPHYSLQKKWFEDSIPGCYNKIIKLEDLNTSIRELNEQKGLGFDLTGLSSSHHHVKNQDLTQNVAKLKWSRLKYNIPGYANFYTTELADKVYELYKEDFEAYGYSKKDYLI